MLHVGGFYDDEGSDYRSGDDSYDSDSSPPSPSSDESDDRSISNSDEDSEGNAFVTVNSEDESDEVSNRVYAYLDMTNDVAELMFLNDGERRPKSSSRKVIPIGWILLDSQSTIDVFSNPKLLRNIHEVRTTLFISCNAGVKTTNLRGELPGYGMVWFYPDGIANILSLSRVKDKFRVTYDSTIDNVFHVHKHDKILKFREATRRLYYFDTCNRDEEWDMEVIGGTTLINTVEENASQLSAYDFNKAKQARQLQVRIGRPSTEHFIRIIKTNQIPNCPVTVRDVQNAEFIWGRELGSIKGKTVRRQPPAVRTEVYNIPVPLMQKYQHVTLSADVMFVCRIPFLMTISRHIKFGTAGKLDRQNDTTILSHFKVVLALYATHGFKVTIVLGDGQFESMRGELSDMGALLNVVAEGEHVPEIERYNRTSKIGCAAFTTCSLPNTFLQCSSLKWSTQACSGEICSL
jgi:hypothetical protein